MLFFTQCFGAVLDLIHLRFQHYKAKRVFSAAGQLVCVVNPTHSLKVSYRYFFLLWHLPVFPHTSTGSSLQGMKRYSSSKGRALLTHCNPGSKNACIVWLYDSLRSNGEATRCSKRSWAVTAPPSQSFLIPCTSVMVCTHIANSWKKLLEKLVGWIIVPFWWKDAGWSPGLTPKKSRMLTGSGEQRWGAAAAEGSLAAGLVCFSRGKMLFLSPEGSLK